MGVGAATRRIDRDVRAGIETESGHHPPDELDVVTWQYAEVITGLVLHSGWQFELDMAGRPRVGIGLTVPKQLPVDCHGGRISPVRHHDGVRRLLVLHREAQPRLGCRHSGRLGGKRQALGQRRPQALVPLRELTVEVGAGVALAARMHPMRAVSLKLRIDQCRYGLVGGGPVHVAAAEDGEGQTGSGVGRRCGVGDPAAEAFGVVGWVAVVGRAHHDQGSLVGQFAGVIIEGSQRDGITAV